MALKASIFKAAVNIADLNRDYYSDSHITIARHPSETDERMMMRLLAFALNADEQLRFGRGLSTDNEPDFWLKNLSDEIDLWIDVGLPSFERCKKAVARAKAVKLYVYGQQKNVSPWWKKVADDMLGLQKLTVLRIAGEDSMALAAMAKTNMQLQFTIDADDIYISACDTALQLQISRLDSTSLEGR